MSGQYKRATTRDTNILVSASAPTIFDRLFSKVISEPNSGCWLWTGFVGDRGYGLIMIGSAKTGWIADGAHRVSFVLHGGYIPLGMFALHKCDTPICVNPDHIFVGTVLDNARDRAKKGRNVHGDDHWTRKNPELKTFGDDHWTRRTPWLLNPRRGEQHPHAKLSDKDVAAIFYDTRSSTIIAKEYGINFGTVCAIRRGEGRGALVKEMNK